MIGNALHHDLVAIKELVFDPCKLNCTQLIAEKQNAEYGAYFISLNELSVRFRVAKITPTKVGHFVTLWERIGIGPTQPYDIAEAVDFYVISTREGNNFGHFIFPKAEMFKQNILSQEGKGGKRGIRVYPIWSETTSPQARKTQKWQLNYFLEIPEDGRIDFERARMLFARK